MPAYGVIAFYKASGVYDAIQELNPEGKQFAPGDILACNYTTHKKIKNFLEKIWSIFSLRYCADVGVTWDTRKYAAGVSHYAKTLGKKVKASVGANFLEYCPFVDDEMEDDYISISIPEESDLVSVDQTSESTNA